MNDHDLDLDAIRRVWSKYAEHINCAGPNCCAGCNLARQIPTLLAEADRLNADNADMLATLTDLEPVGRRLKANQQPAGGAWRTCYGSSLANDDANDVDDLSTERLFDDDRVFRVWIGPIEPVSDSAGSADVDPVNLSAELLERGLIHDLGAGDE